MRSGGLIQLLMENNVNMLLGKQYSLAFSILWAMVLRNQITIVKNDDGVEVL
jgi:hypothetical protein